MRDHNSPAARGRPGRPQSRATAATRRARVRGRARAQRLTQLFCLHPVLGTERCACRCVGNSWLSLSASACACARRWRKSGRLGAAGPAGAAGRGRGSARRGGRGGSPGAVRARAVRRCAGAAQRGRRRCARCPDPPTPTLLLFNWCSMNGTQKRRTKDNRHAHNVVWVPPFTLCFCNSSCGARCALVAAAVEAALGDGRVH